MLELLVVLAVIGLIAAIVVPRLQLAGFASNAAGIARELASDAAKARLSAVFANRPIDLLVDVDRFAVRVGNGPVRKISGLSRLVLVATRGPNRDSGTGVVRFFPDGSSDGAEIALTDTGGNTARIRINWLTGRIDVEI